MEHLFLKQCSGTESHEIDWTPIHEKVWAALWSQQTGVALGFHSEHGFR